MMIRATPPRSRGFTLIEAMVVLAVVAIVVVLAAPSMTRMIEMRRLRGTNDQLLTDVQLARAEAVSRQERVAITFGGNTSMTCYTIHTCGTESSNSCRCDCTAAANEASANGRCDSTLTMREVRTVQLLRSANVAVSPARIGGAANISDRFIIDPTSGAMVAFLPVVVFTGMPTPPSEFWAETTLTSAGGNAAVRTKVNGLGRTEVCLVSGSFSGVSPC